MEHTDVAGGHTAAVLVHARVDTVEDLCIAVARDIVVSHVAQEEYSCTAMLPLVALAWVSSE